MAQKSAHDHDHRHHSDMDAGARARIVERGLLLEYASLAWNVVEVVVSFVAGLAAHSVALVGFALDSIVESSSAAILIWRLRNEDAPGWDMESIERRAVRLVAIAFWLLAGYVGAKAVVDLVQKNHRTRARWA